MQFDVTIVNNVSILQYMMLDVTAKYQKDYMHSCQRLAWWLGQLFFVLTAKTHYDRIRIETCNLPLVVVWVKDTRTSSFLPYDEYY